MHNVIMYNAQGQDTAPVYISTRIVFFFMFLASVVLFESFRRVQHYSKRSGKTILKLTKLTLS